MKNKYQLAIFIISNMNIFSATSASEEARSDYVEQIVEFVHSYRGDTPIPWNNDAIREKLSACFNYQNTYDKLLAKLYQLWTEKYINDENVHYFICTGFKSIQSINVKYGFIKSTLNFIYTNSVSYEFGKQIYKFLNDHRKNKCMTTKTVQTVRYQLNELYNKRKETLKHLEYYYGHDLTGTHACFCYIRNDHTYSMHYPEISHSEYIKSALIKDSPCHALSCIHTIWRNIQAQFVSQGFGPNLIEYIKDRPIERNIAFILRCLSSVHSNKSILGIEEYIKQNIFNDSSGFVYYITKKARNAIFVSGQEQSFKYTITFYTNLTKIYKVLQNLETDDGISTLVSIVGQILSKFYKVKNKSLCPELYIECYSAYLRKVSNILIKQSFFRNNQNLTNICAKLWEAMPDLYEKTFSIGAQDKVRVKEKIGALYRLLEEIIPESFITQHMASTIINDDIPVLIKNYIEQCKSEGLNFAADSEYSSNFLNFAANSEYSPNFVNEKLISIIKSKTVKRYSLADKVLNDESDEESPASQPERDIVNRLMEGVGSDNVASTQQTTDEKTANELAEAPEASQVPHPNFRHADFEKALSF